MTTIGTRRTGAIVVLALLALPLAGCGSGPTPLSAAQLKQKANAICTTAGAKMDALNPGTSPTAQQVEAAVKKLADLLAAEASDLKALTPPEDVAGDYAAMLKDVAHAASVLKEQGSAALTSNQALFEDANKLAAKLGLTACAK